MRVALSQSSVRNAIKEVRRYQGSLPSKLDRALATLAEIGVSTAQGTVRSSMGNVAAAIRFEKAGSACYLVISDDEEAAFAEFGTGVMGEGTYPGELPPEFAGYDLRWTPAAHDPDQPEKWYYYDEEGRRRSTWGQTADAYMFAGSEVMKQMVVPVFKDVFSS